ncbi:MAG TPA: TIM barrel protein [Verrucomicrobiota bacterium]|nr:TIM barrel protein [Verrucomicrobiota bacterium]HNU52086.1 TIM barrel protein [Verrucomicrobiota bacterium]
MKSPLSRRSALKSLATTALVCGAPAVPAAAAEPARLKGNIHHSVSAWCYGGIKLDDLCAAARDMGIESVELLGPDDWPTVRKHGLVCAMCNGPDSIGYGWNRVDHHDKLVADFEKAIPKVAEFGFPNIITFSGNRRGMSDEEGLEHCALGLKRIVPVAEKHKVTIILELLNSKVDHKDYMADHTAWGAEVCRRVGSERLKLLYDIYHMQIMEGDVIRTIRDNIQYIGHFHTGGNPGRHEIDDSQEIYYPAVMRAIVATGFKGFVGQEFVPAAKDKLASLRKAIQICDV